MKYIHSQLKSRRIDLDIVHHSTPSSRTLYYQRKSWSFPPSPVSRRLILWLRYLLLYWVADSSCLYRLADPQSLLQIPNPATQASHRWPITDCHIDAPGNLEWPWKRNNKRLSHFLQNFQSLSAKIGLIILQAYSIFCIQKWTWKHNDVNKVHQFCCSKTRKCKNPTWWNC